MHVDLVDLHDQPQRRHVGDLERRDARRHQRANFDVDRADDAVEWRAQYRAVERRLRPVDGNLRLSNRRVRPVDVGVACPGEHLIERRLRLIQTGVSRVERRGVAVLERFCD
ncbi:MAG: hypothetical protein U0521_05270 [Anaerolineae bacterium]